MTQSPEAKCPNFQKLNVPMSRSFMIKCQKFSKKMSLCAFWAPGPGPWALESSKAPKGVSFLPSFLPCLLAGWLFSFLACLLAGWLPSFLACWLAGFAPSLLACLPAGWLDCFLPCLQAGCLASFLLSLLACLAGWLVAWLGVFFFDPKVFFF